jgi:hypothetical protein
VVLFDVDSSAQARRERSRVVRAKTQRITRVNKEVSLIKCSGSESVTHKMSERIEVFPLPDAPMRRTWVVVSEGFDKKI